MAKTKNLILEEIINIHKAHKEELREKYGVKEIGIFGSYVKEEHKESSDIDLVIEFFDEESKKGLEWIGLMTNLEEYLSRILPAKPHIASLRQAKNSDKWGEIEKEIIYVFKETQRDSDIKKIKETIIKVLNNSGVKVKNIVLFGSRARDDFSKYSDYDLLIITEKTFTIEEKMEIFKKVNQALAKLLIPSDIIIKSMEEVEHLKYQIGVVVREALKEGVEI